MNPNDAHEMKEFPKITRRQFLYLSAAVVGSLPLFIGCKSSPLPPTATPTSSPVPPTTMPTTTNTHTPIPPTEAPTVTPTITPIPPTDTPPPTPTQTIPPTPAKLWPLGDVPRNRTLINYYGDPAAGIFNAYASGYYHQNGNAILYEPCAYYATHLDKTYMWLAESYQYNEDATECTITFRKGIHWSDGKPFNVRDVAWSMQKLKSVRGLNHSEVYKQEVDSVDVVDDYTLVIKLKHSDYRFFFKSLTFRFDLGDDTAVQAPQMFEGVTDSNLGVFDVYDPAKGWPISTGPYGVSDSTEQYTKYDLRHTWWAVETGFVDKYPEVLRLIQQPLESDTKASRLLIEKEIDSTLDLHPLLVEAILPKAEHLSTWTGRVPPYGYVDFWPISIQFCTQKPPFDNPKVRWAVAYAIDQQLVLNTARGGAGSVANSPFPAFPRFNQLMETITDITDQYNVLEHNPKQSSVLMQEAGFTRDTQGFWVDAKGTRPDADLYAAVPLFRDIAPVVAEQLQKAGFSCEHKSPPDVWAAKVDGRASMFLFGHGGGVMDPYDTFMLYRPENTAPMGEQSWSNITRWSTPEFTAITDEMGRISPEDPRIVELFRQAMSIWYAELPDCPLIQWYHHIPVNTWYWTNWPDEQNPYMNSALWHLTMLQVVLGLKATNA